MRFVLVVLILLAVLPASSMAGEVYRSRVEKTTLLPIYRATGAKVVVYSVGPINIPAGSIADIRFQSQLTNDCGNNVGVGRWVIRTTTDRYVNGVFVTPPAIENITPGEHHAVLTQSTLEEFPVAVGGVYYNVIMYAISSDANCYGSVLSIDGANTESGGELVVEIR